MNGEINKLIAMLFEDASIREFCAKHGLQDEDVIMAIGKFIIQKETNKLASGCSPDKCNVDPNGAYRTNLSGRKSGTSIRALPQIRTV